MTPREMFADARRKGYSLSEMLHHGRKNHAYQVQRGDDAATLLQQADALSWLVGLAGDGPDDVRAADMGILDWRFDSYDGRIWLQTLNRETVAQITKGRAGGGFYFQVFKPMAWIIASDPEALAARNQLGQDAVETWSGPHKMRPKAARLMVEHLHKFSVRLFGVDSLMIPDFKLPNR